MPRLIAYMPLNTYPDTPSDPAILASIAFTAALGCDLQISTFAVDIPPVASPIGGFLIDIDGMSRAAEDRSMAECERLQALVARTDHPTHTVTVMNHRLVLGAAFDAAATEARYFDLAVIPWTNATLSTQDLAQALVFDAGLPVILVPPTTEPSPVDHIAIAWDASRVAARAMHDALPFLSLGGRVSVLTVQDEKSLNGSNLAQNLAASLKRRGYGAHAIDINLDGKSIGAALQDRARAEGAQLLAMGGFGHSRLRDFILGGATKNVLGDLRLPTLFAH